MRGVSVSKGLEEKAGVSEQVENLGPSGAEPRSPLSHKVDSIGEREKKRRIESQSIAVYAGAIAWWCYVCGTYIHLSLENASASASVVARDIDTYRSPKRSSNMRKAPQSSRYI